MALTIGTISFARCGDVFLIRPEERVRLIRAAVRRYGPTLLLTAGHALERRCHLKQLAAALAEDRFGTTVVTEVHHDGNRPAKRLSGHALYAVFQDGSWTRLGRQVFAKRQETVGSQGWRVPLFVDRLERRIITVSGWRVLALGCGEINAVQGRANARFIHPRIGETFDAVDVILNLTHDRMGRAGLLDAKRRFLSKAREGELHAYVSCSNWNLCTDSGIPQYPSATIHTCYINGKPSVPVSFDGACGEWGFAYRQFAILEPEEAGHAR
jgi:hypothetical protein